MAPFLRHLHFPTEYLSPVGYSRQSGIMIPILILAGKPPNPSILLKFINKQVLHTWNKHYFCCSQHHMAPFLRHLHFPTEYLSPVGYSRQSGIMIPILILGGKPPNPSILLKFINKQVLHTWNKHFLRCSQNHTFSNWIPFPSGLFPLIRNFDPYIDTGWETTKPQQYCQS